MSFEAVQGTFWLARLHALQPQLVLLLHKPDP